MTQKIQILDYGSGNLFSIKDSIRRISGAVDVIIEPQYRKSEDVDALVLPGVGSFSSALSTLNKNRDAILEDVKGKGVPLLGICLGMQLMFKNSEEGPGEGLGIFKGNVKRFSPAQGRKIPHMGWNTINLTQMSKTEKKDGSRLCYGLDDSEWVYYVHSFYPEPEDAGIVLAWTDYAGQKFPAIIESKNIFGTQFHPEKSHDTGSRIISNFVAFALRG